MKGRKEMMRRSISDIRIVDTRCRIECLKVYYVGASLVIRVNVNEVVNGMMMGMGVVQGGAQGRRCNGSRGWWMIDRLHRGYGRHLIGGTGRHLVHGTGRGHRAP